jgi:hypothetical protein
MMWDVYDTRTLPETYTRRGRNVDSSFRFELSATVFIINLPMVDDASDCELSQFKL